VDAPDGQAPFSCSAGRFHGRRHSFALSVRNGQSSCPGARKGAHSRPLGSHICAERTRQLRKAANRPRPAPNLAVTCAERKRTVWGPPIGGSLLGLPAHWARWGHRHRRAVRGPRRPRARRSRNPAAAGSQLPPGAGWTDLSVCGCLRLVDTRRLRTAQAYQPALGARLEPGGGGAVSEPPVVAAEADGGEVVQELVARRSRVVEGELSRVDRSAQGVHLVRTQRGG
jgi:hypothetical protein